MTVNSPEKSTGSSLKVIPVLFVILILHSVGAVDSLKLVEGVDFGYIVKGTGTADNRLVVHIIFEGTLVPIAFLSAG